MCDILHQIDRATARTEIRTRDDKRACDGRDGEEDGDGDEERDKEVESKGEKALEPSRCLVLVELPIQG